MTSVRGVSPLSYRRLAPCEYDALLDLDFAAEQLDRFLGPLPDIIDAVRRGPSHELVSIREQAAVVVGMLRAGEPLSFRQLVAGADQKGVVIARFLAVLELYRHAAIAFEQLEPLGELTLRWTAEHWSEENLSYLGADYDG